MKTKDLIAQLQKLVDEHEPHVWIMGEHEIVIDVFVRVSKEAGIFQYKGFSGDIAIQKSPDLVYDILCSPESFIDENPIYR